MQKSDYDMIYLVGCALTDITPNAQRLAEMDMDALYTVCQRRSLTAMVCFALERAGICHQKFMDAKLQSLRKNILLETEQKRICAHLEKNGIWYMPLKGAYLKYLYPKMEMRQMSDVDILYDGAFQNQVIAFMQENGYDITHEDEEGQDVCIKPPVLNLEMHTRLFGSNMNDAVYRYYENVKARLLKDENTGYGYHFSDEDFYIFMTAHTYKHYTVSGTGIRSLLDTAVYFLKKGDRLDIDYIEKELEKMGIAEFEQEIRAISLRLFTEPELSLSEKEMKTLEFFLSAGTYGTWRNMIAYRIQKYGEATGEKSKFRYIMSRLFPSMDFCKKNYPFFYKYKILLPFLWIFRVFRLIFVRRSVIADELSGMKRLDSERK